MDNKITGEVYASKIEDALKEKYGQTFNVESVSGSLGSHDDSTVKAWCFSTEGKYKNVEFIAEIGRENFEVKDTYLNLEAASLISDKLTDFYGSDAICLTQIETPTEYSNAMNIEDVALYINEFSGYYITSFLFIKSDDDNELLSKKIYEYAKKLENLKFRDLSVIVFVVHDLSENISKKYYESDGKYDAFISDSNVVKHSGFQLNSRGLLTSKKEIQSVFEKGK